MKITLDVVTTHCEHKSKPNHWPPSSAFITTIIIIVALMCLIVSACSAASFVVISDLFLYAIMPSRYVVRGQQIIISIFNLLNIFLLLLSLITDNQYILIINIMICLFVIFIFNKVKIENYFN